MADLSLFVCLLIHSCGSRFRRFRFSIRFEITQLKWSVITAMAIFCVPVQFCNSFTSDWPAWLAQIVSKNIHLFLVTLFLFKKINAKLFKPPEPLYRSRELQSSHLNLPNGKQTNQKKNKILILQNKTKYQKHTKLQTPLHSHVTLIWKRKGKTPRNRWNQPRKHLTRPENPAPPHTRWLVRDEERSDGGGPANTSPRASERETDIWGDNEGIYSLALSANRCPSDHTALVRTQTRLYVSWDNTLVTSLVWFSGFQRCYWESVSFPVCHW